MVPVKPVILDIRAVNQSVWVFGMVREIVRHSRSHVLCDTWLYQKTGKVGRFRRSWVTDFFNTSAMFFRLGAIDTGYLFNSNEFGLGDDEQSPFNSCIRGTLMSHATDEASQTEVG
jgi:hypothetical protein